MKCDCGTDMKWKRTVNSLNGIPMIIPFWICPACRIVVIDDRPIESQIQQNRRKIEKIKEAYDFEI